MHIRKTKAMVQCSAIMLIPHESFRILSWRLHGKNRDLYFLTYQYFPVICLRLLVSKLKNTSILLVNTSNMLGFLSLPILCENAKVHDRLYMSTYLNTMDTISSKLFVNKFKNIASKWYILNRGAVIHVSVTCQD